MGNWLFEFDAAVRASANPSTPFAIRVKTSFCGLKRRDDSCARCPELSDPPNTYTTVIC